MNKFLVKKSNPLNGTITISGSKNSALPILAATILTDEVCKIHCIPALQDVYIMLKILNSLGADAQYDKEEECVIIDPSKIKNYEEDYELASKMRASFLVMGSLLAKYKKALIPLPGGCPIGSRPVDLHLKGFQALGATVTQNAGCIEVTANNLVGTSIYLDFPSVGATENIMMAATLAIGKTVIENAATEPEICDLANFLICMGADILGAGTDKITINGVKKLKGIEYKVIPDRIEAGTFMIAAAITKGDITLKNVIPEHLKPVIAKLEECNMKTEYLNDSLRIYYLNKLSSLNIKTLPFPGFPTDLQAPFMSLLATIEGTSIITETIFENRFMHASELKRMGADIDIDSRSAVIKGVKSLNGTKVRASDLRAGAALVLSALVAEGDTEISDIYHIERGYYKMEKKLKNLGAKIEKIN